MEKRHGMRKNTLISILPLFSVSPFYGFHKSERKLKRLDIIFILTSVLMKAHETQDQPFYGC